MRSTYTPAGPSYSDSSTSARLVSPRHGAAHPVDQRQKLYTPIYPTPCPNKKKVPMIFFAITFANIGLNGFLYLSCTTSQDESPSTWCKNFMPRMRFVATVPCLTYKSNTFHALLAPCACLYRTNLINLRKPVSTRAHQEMRYPNVT